MQVYLFGVEYFDRSVLDIAQSHPMHIPKVSIEPQPER